MRMLARGASRQEDVKEQGLRGCPGVLWCPVPACRTSQSNAVLGTGRSRRVFLAQSHVRGALLLLGTWMDHSSSWRRAGDGETQWDIADLCMRFVCVYMI